MAGVERGKQALRRIPLPGHQHPQRAGVRLFKSLLDLLRRHAHRDVARSATLLKHLHVVDRGFAEKHPLVPVERLRQEREAAVARVQPAGPHKAVPVTLCDDMRPGVHRAEVRRHNAVVARQHRRDSQAAQTADQTAGRGRALPEQGKRNRLLKAAHVAHQLPVLVGRLHQPVPDRLVRVPGIAKGLVQDQVRAPLDQHRVESAQRQHIDLVLPPGVAPVRGRIPVHVLVQRVAPAVPRTLFDRGGRRGQLKPGGAELRAIGRYLQVRNILQVPVHAVQQGGLRTRFHQDVAPASRDAEAILGQGPQLEVQLRCQPGHQAPENALGGRGSLVGPKRCSGERRNKQKGKQNQPKRAPPGCGFARAPRRG